MKKWFILLLCWLPFLSTSQVVTVSEDLSIRNNTAYDLIGRLEDRILLYREKSSSKFEIQAYDERLRLSWDKTLELDHKKSEVIAVIPNRDQFSIIYRYKKKGVLYLKANKYDPAANLVDSTTIAQYNHRFMTPKFQVTYSEDKRSVLLFSIEKQTKVKALSFNLNNMQLRWDSKFTLTDPSFYTNHMEVLVTNKGDMFFMVSHNNRKSKRDEHYYEILNCRQGSSKVERMTIPMDGKLSYDVVFSYDNLNRNLVAGGLYSNKNLNRTNGYFSMKMPVGNPQNYSLNFTPFDDDFVSDLEGKRIKNTKGINDVEIREIVLRRDGGMLLVYEMTKLYERRLASAGRGFGAVDGLSYTVDYYYDNLFVISVHPDGQTHWKNILHKKQYSQDDNAAFSSYFLLKTPSSLRFLFNDEIRYENTVSEYVIKGSGEYDRNSVLSTEDQDIRLRFQDAMQIASNELLVPSERRNQLRLVRVTY
ncbi:MAG: hypothetical protein AAF985_04365 [Bacteroidota bacterium]